jgi:hypothetical protein
MKVFALTAKTSPVVKAAASGRYQTSGTVAQAKADDHGKCCKQNGGGLINHWRRSLLTPRPARQAKADRDGRSIVPIGPLIGEEVAACLYPARL